MSVYIAGVCVLVYNVYMSFLLGSPAIQGPSNSTRGHLESQVEGITQQHNVQIQEAFTKVVFHRARPLSFIVQWQSELKNKDAKTHKCLQTPKESILLLM